jgi:hypothetical protein
MEMVMVQRYVSDGSFVVFAAMLPLFISNPLQHSKRHNDRPKNDLESVSNGTSNMPKYCGDGQQNQGLTNFGQEMPQSVNLLLRCPIFGSQHLDET